MTITELEAFYDRLDKVRMTPADRALAKARLEQADALAAYLHALVAGLKKLVPAARGARERHGSGLRPTV